jgi:SAM-dependent methyltransferase
VSKLEFDPGSFRDPKSRVLIVNGQVIRSLTKEALADFDFVEEKRFFREALREGRVVGTERTNSLDLQSLEIDNSEGLLVHERIPFVSYPYEWTFHMLKEAALLHLDLIREALEEGAITKDGSPFNVQWRGTQPTFIDVSSFEPLDEGSPWAGYRQFCELFLFPLMLQAYKGVAFQPWLRGSVDGVPAQDLHSLMSWTDYFRKGVLTHVVLHSKLQSRYQHSTEDAGSNLKAAGFRKEMIISNVERLSRLVRRLEPSPPKSGWSEYRERAHYSAEDLAAKDSFVKRAAASAEPSRLVWDLGCNDGRYSRLVAGEAEYVVAIDADPDVVDRLFEELRAESNQRIHPLCINLADPTPAIGWRNRERKTLEERGRPDLVLCLALVHHLTITHNVPLSEVVNWISSLDARAVVEFPHREDPMVQDLLRRKPPDIHDDYQADNFRRLLEEQFFVESTEALPSGTRTLFQLAPKN